MESLVASVAPAGYFCYSHDPNAVPAGSYMSQQQMPFAMVPTLPSTPIYSRPGSSCSQQPAPVLRQMTSVPSNLTPMSSPPTPLPCLAQGLVNKPSIMLETELRDMDPSRYPSTPPLSSTSTSSVGSPGSCDMLVTPLNPMFSGLENFQRVKESCAVDISPDNLSLAGWASCTSPPLTPVFISAQSQHSIPIAAEAVAGSNELLSASACPSLSPSPSPYPRSIASEQDNDFCDPRNLTVSVVEDELQPETSVLTSLCPSHDEEDYVSKAGAVDIHSVSLDSALHSLPSVDDFPDLDSEDDFVNELVNLGGAELPVLSSVSPAVEMPSRSRSSSSLSSSSEFNCDQFFDTWESSSALPTDLPAIKRQRTSSDAAPLNMVMAAGAESSTSGNAAQTSGGAADHPSDSSDNGTQSPGSSGAENASGDGKSSAPISANRRGRKQSLTEDPSKIFACDLCNRRFRRQEHLKRHYRSLHTQEKPFSCHECGKKFSRSDNLAQHARTHGAGAFVMNLYDDPDIVAAATGGYPGHPMFPQHPVAMGDDYSNMGQVLFQVAAEIPGSGSDVSDDASEGKKKRKRAE